MLIVTTETIPGKKITKVFGYVAEAILEQSI